ncbi:MAG: carbamoyltransferase HypF [Thermodesulfobacteriota bacterium]|nr:carbamoyltransferase HypF [Thermodesulfobacteriota bacterium]
MTYDYVAKKLNINGIVQGVGFRPFVYKLASQYEIKGDVSNTSSGIVIHIEGIRDNIESFCRDLTEKSPPLAHITETSIHPETVKGFKEFSIQQSIGQAACSTLISPDVSICDDCLRELFDPDDRRFQYPFINCTNCGPRYTIISDIPYDRPKTSMKHFKMCKMCQDEYDDPGNRRFHAQPNACKECGPHVTLYDNSRKKLDVQNPVEKTAELLKQGYVVAIKGLGGFHLAVDAANNDAVSMLRSRKHREEKPLAIMSCDIEYIRKYAYVQTEEEELLKSFHRPIVILKKKKPNPLSKEVSPRNRYFGVMLPYTPLHYLLLSHGFTALIMTSGNMSEEPICIDNEDAFERLSKIADYFLIHNRDIYLRSDDSIVKYTAGNTRFIRRSRGYIPVPVFLKKQVAQILACGGGLKSTICLTKGNNAFISQHIGDLDNQATYEFYQLTIRHMKRILDIDPVIIAHDVHPDYLSTIYALEQQNIKKVPVQHHHAHIVSCMAENRLDGPVIGLSFDGTGYGTDGSIWGGEILIVEDKKFERAAHLSYVSMPGSEAAIKEPWRMAVSYLYDAFGEELYSLDLPVLKEIDKNKIRFIVEMISKQINSPSTSSLGRFFDGIAAIIGIRNYVVFEGQAAMELEMLAEKNINKTYDFKWISGDMHKIFLQPIVCGVVDDMSKGVHPSDISSKFHATIIKMFSELCDVIRKESGLNRIALSGGVFQNSIILTGLIEKLKEKGFQVFTHTQVSANDGGISLGQAMVAAAVANS